MVLETSAAIAIVQREPSFEVLQNQMERASLLLMSAVSYMEASVVLHNRGNRTGLSAFERLLSYSQTEIVEVDLLQAQLARDAHARFGKGRGHPAKLNLADCFAYALAIYRRHPLLFVGNDFIHTDVLRA